ncbi:DUF6177 family protein [Streptomyces sp. NPDC000405]|uniref:DUF6177 family protein n=1 Tax=Streptomyces sp. NPDC000405 TaxID=3161033 RepID=UPI00398C8930
MTGDRPGAGRDRAARTPLPEAPLRLGPESRPGFFYALGDGESDEGWGALETLIRHLRGA